MPQPVPESKEAAEQELTNCNAWVEQFAAAKQQLAQMTANEAQIMARKGYLEALLAPAPWAVEQPAAEPEGEAGDQKIAAVPDPAETEANGQAPVEVSAE